MKRPLFSIVIPTLNEENYLPKLLESLTLQTMRDFEVIVVDGSSKDKTVVAARRFTKRLPMLSIRICKEANLSRQRNLGAQSARGQWVVFLDSDNVMLPYAMERCRAYVREHVKVKFFTTWFMPDSEISGDAVLILISNLFVESGKIVRRQIAPGPFAAVRRDVFIASGGYDEQRGYGEDQEFSMRLYEQGIELDFLRETIYVYSLRRFRKQGTLKMMQFYAKNSLITLITKRAPNNIPGYIMGGHLYSKKKTLKRSVLNEYERKLKTLMKELFS